LTSSPDRKPRDSNPSPESASAYAAGGELRFTVRRPPTGEVSPCSHRPSGGDVACGVDVGVAPSSIAGLALEDRLALAVPGCDVPAHRTTLRRVRSRDLLDPAERLMLQTCHELAPTTSADLAVEPTLLGDSDSWLLDGATGRAGHRPHVKGLDPTQVDLPRDVSGGFLNPIPTPILLAGSEFRNRPLGLVAAIGATFAAAELLLQHLQPPRLPLSQTRCVQQFAGRQCTPAVPQQRLLLLRGGQQPKPRHVRTVTTATDIADRSARPSLGNGFAPRLKSRISSRRRLR